MKLGTYRNALGKELMVTGFWDPRESIMSTFQSLGGIYTAETPKSFLGSTYYLVTEDSLADCGYEFIEDLP